MFRRFFRFLFNLFLAALAAGFTVLLVLYWFPDMQKSLLLRYLENDPRRSYQVEHMQLRFNGFEGTGIFVLDGGNGVQLDQINLAGPLLFSALRREVKVTSGRMDGVFIDLSMMHAGGSFDPANFLTEANEYQRKRWMTEQIRRVLSYLDQQGWTYDIRDVHIDGSLLMPGFYLQFVLEVERADNDAIELEVLSFELN